MEHIGYECNNFQFLLLYSEKKRWCNSSFTIFIWNNVNCLLITNIFFEHIDKYISLFDLFEALKQQNQLYQNFDYGFQFWKMLGFPIESNKASLLDAVVFELCLIFSGIVEERISMLRTKVRVFSSSDDVLYNCSYKIKLFRDISNWVWNNLEPSMLGLC